MFDTSEPCGYESAYVQKPGVPSRVQAAFHFVQLSTALNPLAHSGDVPVAARKKGEAESMTLEAAYMVIRHYLTGEMTYDEKPQIYELPAPKHPVYACDSKPLHPLAKGSGA